VKRASLTQTASKTSARMEAAARAQADPEQAPRPLVVVTDSKYVYTTVRRKREDPGFVPGDHGHWWELIRAGIARVKEIRWQKAHLTRDENRERGGTDREWTLNHRADEAATAGIKRHIDEPAQTAEYNRRVLEIADIQTHINHRLKEYAAGYPTESGKPGELAQRPGRAKRSAHRTDPLQAFKSRRQINRGTTLEWCQKCGRQTKNGGRRHAHMKVRREPCRDTAQVAGAKPKDTNLPS